MSIRARFAATAIAAALTVAASLVVKWEPPPDQARMLVAIQPIPGDPWTICYGHTRGVYQGMTATPEQCEAWLHEDLMIAHQAIERCIDVPLAPGTHGAFLSAVYNLGPTVVCGSTLQRKANVGDIEGACRELTHARNSDGGERGWSFAQGRYYQGLRNRRFDERAVCWPDFSNVVSGVASTARVAA